MLNKKILIETLKEVLFERACDNYEKPDPLDRWEEVHDECLFLTFNGIRVEDHPIMYGEMFSIVNKHWEEIADEVNDYMDDNCQPYYGDPAFASAHDYWSYILG